MYDKTYTKKSNSDYVPSYLTGAEGIAIGAISAIAAAILFSEMSGGSGHKEKHEHSAHKTLDRLV